MSAVLEVREPSARYLDTLQPPLVQQFDRLSRALGGVARLRELILSLAVQGKLVLQHSGDEPAAQLLERSRSRMREKMNRGDAKKEKPSTAVDESEQWFATPSGWQWCRLTDTGEYVNGLAFKPSDWHANGLPIIRIQNLSGRSPEFNRTKGEFDRSVIVNAGDILVSWSATLAAFIWQGETGVLNQHIFRVEPAPCVDKGYLFWLLKWAIRDLAESDHAHGLVMSHINRGPFLAKPIPLPPLAEQARIAARVHELMRLCDALEEKGRLEAEQHARLLGTLLGTLTESATPEELAANWQRVAKHFDLLLDRPEAVDALEHTILRLAVQGLLVAQDPADQSARSLLASAKGRESELDDDAPQLPRGWVWARLGQVADSRLGKMLDKAKNRGKPRPYLRNTNVQWRRFELDDIKQMNLEDSELQEFRLRPGDLLICEGGEPGRCAIWRGESPEMYFQKALHRVRPRPGVSADFIAISIESDALSDSLSSYFTGATIKHLVGQALERYAFALAPSAEQLRIVARVTELRRLCATLRERLQAQQATQSRLAEALVEQATA